MNIRQNVDLFCKSKHTCRPCNYTFMYVCINVHISVFMNGLYTPKNSNAILNEECERAQCTIQSGIHLDTKQQINIILKNF